MSKPLKILSVVVASCGFMFLILAWLPDFIQFHKIMGGNYGTPWYDSEWWKEPYTHSRLMGKPTKVYWTKNAIGTPWLVKEVSIGDKQFWTVLQGR